VDLGWLRRLTANRRAFAIAVARNLAVAAVCVAGVVIYARVLDAKYPVAEWLVWRLMPVWGYALLWNAACVAGGAAVLRLLLRGRDVPVVEWLLQSMAVGLVLFTLALYLFGSICLLAPWLSLLLPAVMLAAGVPAVRDLLPRLRSFRTERPVRSLPWEVIKFLVVGWGLVCIGMLYVEALSPTDLSLHTTWPGATGPADYASAGCLVPSSGDARADVPHLTGLVHVWAFLVPGIELDQVRWMLVLHLEFAMVVWRIVGVAAVAHWLLDEEDTPGLWPVFFLFPAIFVQDHNIAGSALHYLGFFAAPVFLALARFLGQFDWRTAVLLGAVLGGQALTRFAAAYLLVAVTGAVLLRIALVALQRGISKWRHRPDGAAGLPGWRSLVIGAAVLFATTVAVDAPHLIHHGVHTGNPLYPFAGSVIPTTPPGPAATASRATAASRDGSPTQAGREVPQRSAIRALYMYAFEPDGSGEKDRRPYRGALFSLLLPCVLFIRRSRRVWLGLAIGVVAFWVWVATHGDDRFLVAFQDLLIATAAALMVRVWQVGWVGRAPLVALVALQLIWGGDAMIHYGGERLKDARRLVGAGYDRRYDADRFAPKRGRSASPRRAPRRGHSKSRGGRVQAPRPAR
jgi:hypothetical protein